jgi:hypothetical protein
VSQNSYNHAYEMLMYARTQPQYYEYIPNLVEQELWGAIDPQNTNDQRLLHAIFQSQEWKSQSAPISEDYIRQLRHQLDLPSGVVYRCPFCAVTEGEANHMTEHIQAHFGLRPYSCGQWYVADSL